MKDLFVVGRAMELWMLDCGRSVANVSRHINVSRRSVSRWRREFFVQGTVARGSLLDVVERQLLYLKDS